MLDAHNLQHLIQRIGIGYLVADRQLIVTAASDTFCALFGTVTDACVGQPLPAIVPELIGSEAELVGICEGRVPYLHLPMVNRSSDEGQIAYFNFVVLPFLAYEEAQERGSPVGLIFASEDVTELARIEQAVTQNRNELALLRDQLAAQNLQILAANAELRRLDELKSKFVSIVAHELRSPLSTVTSYLTMLGEPRYGGLSAQQSRFRDAVERSATRLTVIIDDLLDLTRIATGHMEIVLVAQDLDALVSAVLDDFAPRLAAREQALARRLAADLPPVLCDAQRVTQILHNLVSNAHKYTPDGGQITVYTGLAAETGYVQISIADDGIGIPATDHDQIFATFFRAGNVDQAAAAGAGLGLHITRALVELHGGRIWFEDNADGGATFHVTLPCLDPAPIRSDG